MTCLAPDHARRYNPPMDLFTHAMNDRMKSEAPLAARLERWRAAQREALNITETRELPDLDMGIISDIKRKHRASSGATSAGADNPES